jgi:hypothetical protein
MYRGEEVMFMADPTPEEVDALAREMVEDQWPYDRRWATTPKATKDMYRNYARMLLMAGKTNARS